MTPENLISRLEGFEKATSGVKPGGIILVEIDRFRQLRSQLGYRLLFGLVRKVRQTLVAELGEGGEVYRFGLSRFVIALPEVSSEELQATANRLFNSLGQQTFEVGDDSIAISSSVALARFDPRFAGADRMMVALSDRLEQVLASGGNEIAYVEPGVSSTLALDSEDHMLGLLMDALRRNSLKVVFQPLLATRSEESLRSYQMLPRLKASDGQLIPAAEFISVARAARLLPVLDHWMINRAVKLLRGPLESQAVRLFVNQSGAVLGEPDRLEGLIETLGKFSGSNGVLVVELRLDEAMAHLKQAARLIKEARNAEAAVCFSVVDEHSRWDLLDGDLGCDFLRMSPGFVKRLTTEPDLESRFLEISKPAREKGIRIIMPMIEDQETAASMWRSGADFMQGNMIQEPEDTIGLEEA
jgi:EAL domain-containing protein (putative c-di-GMP-specific phosphodiesterase class I)/GGDEF domain-containing protein